MSKYLAGTLVVAAVVAAIAGALMLVESPAEERERRLDDKRVDDLAAIGRAADLFKSRRGVLPADLGELVRETGSSLSTTDPATNAAYTFRVVSPDRYELCASFTHASARPVSPGDFWYHEAGSRCFRLTVQDVRR